MMNTSKCQHVSEIEAVRHWRKLGLDELLVVQKKSHQLQLGLIGILVTSALALCSWLYLDAQQASATEARTETRLQRVEMAQEQLVEVVPQLARVEGKLDAIILTIESLERRIERTEER